MSRAAALAQAATASAWDGLPDVARRHRIAPLIDARLSEAGIAPPAAIARAIAAAAAEGRRRNLIFAAEELRLHAAFAAAGIDALSIKGNSVAILAYGTLAVKTSRDLDILVAPDALDGALAVLAAAGFVPDFPGPELSRAGFARWMAAQKEARFVQPDRGVVLELHVGLADNRRLVPGIGMASPRQDVPLAPGRTVPTLAREPLFAYLCVHGAMHAWSRLKWLADVAAFVGPDADAAARLHAAAAALGAERSATVALQLCHDLFDMAPPPVAPDRAARRLIALSRRALATPADFGHRVGEELALTVSGLTLEPGARFALAALGTAAFFPYRPGFVAAPRALWPALSLALVPGWLLKRAAAALR